jgi:hypothetical protein
MEKEFDLQEHKTKALDMNDAIRSCLKDVLKNNLKVKVEFDWDYSTSICKNFDVIVEFDGEEMSKTDFEVNFPSRT